MPGTKDLEIRYSRFTLSQSTRNQFWNVDPYPHLAVDNFFEPEFFSALSNSMRLVSARGAVTHDYNDEIQRKQCFGPASFDDNIHAAITYMSQGTFLESLENLLEVRALVPLTTLKDQSHRSFFHVSADGGFLGSHVDESYVGKSFRGRPYPFLKKHIHVCSCVFYGSTDWKTEDGGHTILFDATGKNKLPQ